MYIRTTILSWVWLVIGILLGVQAELPESGIESGPSCSFLLEACVAEDGSCANRLEQLLVALQSAKRAVETITIEFQKQILPVPPRVKIHEPHDDFNFGTTYHIDYFPFCHETYFNWLLCHASHVHRETVTQLDHIAKVNELSTVECFREIQNRTLKETEYISDERTPALGLKRRSRRSVSFHDEERIYTMPKTLATWHNIGFFILGTVLGVVLGVACHYMYNFHVRATVSPLISYASGLTKRG